jgi:DNA processing protein
VLPCGVDRLHPAGNTALFERIAQQGLPISEQPPGIEASKERFATRNRLIAAAAADAAVLVESAARGTGLDATVQAAALGKTAMAVPGPVTSAMSTGCHELLGTDARVRLVTGAEHVLAQIGEHCNPHRHPS